MELRGLEPLPPACHATAKKTANTGNLSFLNFQTDALASISKLSASFLTEGVISSIYSNFKKAIACSGPILKNSLLIFTLSFLNQDERPSQFDLHL